MAFQSANDNNDADAITEVCETLYGNAAKCNRHIGGATSKSYQSYQQEDNEYSVCSFIATVVTGTYDEYGYIYVDPTSFSQDNKFNQYQYSSLNTRDVVTKGQVFGILFVLASLIGTLVYANTLRKEVEDKAEFLANGSPVGMDRQTSGIMMARSQTVDGNYRAPSGRLA